MKNSLEEITPLKNYRIFSPPKFDIRLREGENTDVPTIFLRTLLTEGVISDNQNKQKKRGKN